MTFIVAQWHTWLALLTIGYLYAIYVVTRRFPDMADKPAIPPEKDVWFPLAGKSEAIEALIAFFIGFIGSILFIISSVETLIYSI